MQKRILGGLAALTLALASCGGPSTPPPSTDTRPTPAQPVAGADGLSASREFTMTGFRPGGGKRPTAQVLSVQSLQAQDTPPTGDELRYKMEVTRVLGKDGYGRPESQKKYTVKMIWGNRDVKLKGEVKVTAHRLATGISFTHYIATLYSIWNNNKGKPLEWEVKAPEFQDSKTFTALGSDLGPTCLAIQFDLATVEANPAYFVQGEEEARQHVVCEGAAEKDAERVALEKAIKDLKYYRNKYYRTVAAPLTFVRWEGERNQGQYGSPQRLTLEEFRQIAGIPASTPIYQDWYFWNVADGQYDRTPEDKTLTKRYRALKNEFARWYTESHVFYTQEGENYKYYIVGVNSWGVGGVVTHALDGDFEQPDSLGVYAYGRAGTVGQRAYVAGDLDNDTDAPAENVVVEIIPPDPKFGPWELRPGWNYELPDDQAEFTCPRVPTSTGGHKLRCNLGTVPAGAFIELPWFWLENAPVAGEPTATYWVTSSTLDLDGSNNHGTASTTISPPPTP